MTVIRGCPTSPGGRPASQSQPFHIYQASATLYMFVHLQCRVGMYENIRLIPILILNPSIYTRPVQHSTSSYTPHTSYAYMSKTYLLYTTAAPLYIF